MNLEAHEMNMVQTMEVPECPLFGKAFDPNEEECQNCIDSEDCKSKMEEETKPKKSKKKNEVKNKKEIKVKPIKVFDKDEFKEYSAATLYSEMEYVEVEEKVVEVEPEKPVKKVTGKGMRKPPFNGRGGKGNTASYIEWLLYSGHLTFDQMVKKAKHYHDKHGAKAFSTPMDKYIKGAISWLKKNKNATETITEDGKIKVRL